MMTQVYAKYIKKLTRVLQKSNHLEGSTLLYIVLVMVIFGVLGATMVALFTSSSTSSATLNEDHRVRYIHESAVRYLLSELREQDFSNAVVTELNNTTYNSPQMGTFSFNLFGPWYDSDGNHILSGAGTLNLKVPQGELPVGYLDKIPTSAPYLSVINYEFSGEQPAGDASALITSFTAGTQTTFQLNLNDDFVAGNNDRIVLATKVYTDSIVMPLGSIDVERSALNIFPRHDGVFEVHRRIYTYKELRDRTTHAQILGVWPLKTYITPLAVDTTDYIMLSPVNNIIAAKAQTDHLTYGESIDTADFVFDHTLKNFFGEPPDIDNKEFVENLETPESDSDFITPDTTPGQEKLIIGGGSGDVFGGAWYDADKAVGGDSNYCSAGECRFEIGFRTFFTFTKTGDGRGFTFSVLNGNTNSRGSIGGDIEASELLAYSGDSRVVASAAAPPSTDYLDGTGEGLQPPKLAIEFDAVINYDPTPGYCSSPTNLRTDTRNDPLSSNKDAVQYVFWGQDTFIDIPCRDPSNARETYDDNRHDALSFSTSGEWASNLFGNIHSSPIIGPDGTIYIGSDNFRVWAINPGDGSKKWEYRTDNHVNGAPAFSPNKSIVYATSEDGKLYSLDAASGALNWSFDTGNPIVTTPTVDSSGFIYISVDSEVLKFDPASPSSPVASFSTPLNDPIRSAPVLNSDESRIYVIFDDQRLYALNSSDLTRVIPPFWLIPSPTVGDSVGSPVVHPTTGDIYVARNTGPTSGGIAKWGSNGFFGGAFGVSTAVTTGPVLSQDSNFVYAGFNSGALISKTASLGSSWSYVTGTGQAIQGTPSTQENGHIYFGSDDGRVYALSGTGQLMWSFQTGDYVRTRPAVGNDGTVYAGSFDDNIWSIDTFAVPRNYRQNIVPPRIPELGQNLVAVNEIPIALEPHPSGLSLMDPNDWFKEGPWAVRMEITRNTITSPSPGRGDYELRTWIYQCGDSDCSDLLGTAIEKTRYQFDPGNLSPQLVQSFSLTNQSLPGEPDHIDFYRFLFGFTSAAEASDSQVITINNFQLSIIRTTDEVYTEDFLP